MSSTPHYNTDSNYEDTIEYLPLVDYLAYTVKVDSAQSLHGEALYWVNALGGGTLRERGMHGYTHAYSVCGGSGVVCWHPERADMGVHVVLPGSALAMLPEYGDIQVTHYSHDVGHSDTVLTPERLISIVLESGGRFSRLDVAQDTSEVTIEQVASALWSGELVSRSHGMRKVENFSREDDSTDWQKSGATYYVGSRTSERLVRFYDKSAEQGVSVAGYTKPWVRCEVEFKKHAAQRAAEHIADGETIASLILSTIDFRSGDDENVTRRQRLPWWEKWIGIGAKVSFAKSRVEKTIVESLAWVEAAVAPTLAMLAIAGADLRELVSVVTDKGFSRLDASRRQRAHAFRDAGGEVIPSIPASLDGVYDDLQVWIVNKLFSQAEMRVA